MKRRVIMSHTQEFSTIQLFCLIRNYNIPTLYIDFTGVLILGNAGSIILDRNASRMEFEKQRVGDFIIYIMLSRFTYI